MKKINCLYSKNKRKKGICVCVCVYMCICVYETIKMNKLENMYR